MGSEMCIRDSIAPERDADRHASAFHEQEINDDDEGEEEDSDGDEEEGASRNARASAPE